MICFLITTISLLASVGLAKHDSYGNTVTPSEPQENASGVNLAGFPKKTPADSRTVAQPACPMGDGWSSSYNVSKGDTCISIASSANTSTLTFQNLNCLNAQCTNLLLDSTVCLPPPCKTYLVQSGDTCSSIATKQGLSLDNFFGYNPDVVNPGCSNLLAGTTVCLDAASGNDFVMPSCMAPGGGNSTQPAQGRIAVGTSASCPSLYTAMPGDTCNKIIEEAGIHLEEFYAQNPGVRNPSCSNLVPGDRYCVAKEPGEASGDNRWASPTA